MKFFQLDTSPTWRLIKQAIEQLSPHHHPTIQDELQTTHTHLRSPDTTKNSSFITEVRAFSRNDHQLIQRTEDTTMKELELHQMPTATNHTILRSPNHSDDKVSTDSENSLSFQELFTIINQMRQAEDIDTLLNITVDEIRQRFQVNRALIYCFQTDEQGTVLAESMDNDYTPSLGESLPAIAFGAKKQQDYQQQPIWKVNHVGEGFLSPYQHQLFERFQIKANLSFPILLENKVWGLLAVQQCSEPRLWQEAEMALLHQIVAELRVGLQAMQAQTQLKKRLERDKKLAKVVNKIHQSPNVMHVFNTTTQELRQQLKCDRVAVYRFNPDWSGEFVAEAVGKGWVTLVGPDIKTVWADTYMQDTQGGRYRNDETLAVDDIYKAGHQPCHIEILEQFEVRAYIIVPIFDKDKLWGLLAAYQNSGPRHWEEEDISLLVQVSRQFGASLRQAEFLEKLQIQANQITEAAEQERLMSKIVERIRQPLDLNTVLKTTAKEIRSFLAVDRVAVFRFDPESSFNQGEILAEDVQPEYVSALAAKINDHCFSERHADLYRRGRVWAVTDIYQANLEDCYIELLSQFQVRGNLVVPLLKGNELWGLFCIHQCSGPREWKESEIEFAKRIAAQLNVAIQQGEYIEQLQQQSEERTKAAQQERLISKIVERIRQSLKVQEALRITAKEIRGFLNADRVAIFKFDIQSRYSEGETVAEDVRPGYVSLLSTKITDHCFSEEFAEEYRKGRICAIPDIHEAGLQECYVELLSRFQVHADLVVPLLKGNELWGLFCIHQCSGPREWKESEIEFAKRIAAQLNVAIQQGEYLEQLQPQLEAAIQREKAAKEQLQQEVMQLLSAVRPALKGDLTVRAPVTDSEVGTIADAYNNTLGSLRQIVVQMQSTAKRVAQTSATNDSAINELATHAQQQLQVLNQALEEIQTMVHSTQAVGANARQVEVAVQQASHIVQEGNAAIDRTVDEILNIRETVAETNKRLKRLSEASQKISRVVSLIGHFTTQTQLLALNASIEATRAGEYGRGFAVVADEVRALARQSAEAATEIGQLVEDIQASTAEVATAMEVSIQQVTEGTHQVNGARQNLSAIMNATIDISQSVEQIAQATQEQTQQCQRVTEIMSEVAAIANQTSSDSIVISKSFKELLAMAQDLQTRSDQFKVA